jgi:hypothetical protein
MSGDNNLSSHHPPTGDPLASIAYSAFFQMLRSLAHEIAKVPRPISVDVLTMREIIRYFVEERPADRAIDHGALLIRRGFRTPGPINRRVTLCFQVFLDANHVPCQGPDGEVYGRAMVVRRFDAELKAHLMNHDLVIFQ